MVRKKTTKVQDASSMIGEELALEMDDEERKRREKGELRDGMVYKFQEGTLPSHIITMEAAHRYQAAEERLERLNEDFHIVRGCLENIWSSGASIDEIVKKTVKLFQEASQHILTLGGK